MKQRDVFSCRILVGGPLLSLETRISRQNGDKDQEDWFKILEKVGTQVSGTRFCVC